MIDTLHSAAPEWKMERIVDDPLQIRGPPHTMVDILHNTPPHRRMELIADSGSHDGARLRA